MASFANEALVQSIFDAAATDPMFLNDLERDPTGVFRSVGMLIPEETREEFDAFFKSQTSALLPALHTDGVVALKIAWPSLGCTVCTVGAWTVAALIVAVGAAAVAGLTVSSPCVVALAGWAGVAAPAALAFIKTLATAIAAGIAAVAKSICKWIKACP